MGDIIPFQKAQRKTHKQFLDEIASAIALEGHPFARAWPHLYRTIEPDSNVRLILKETGDQELHEVQAEHLAYRIIAWMRLQNVPEWIISHKDALDACKYFKGISQPIPAADIKSVRWLDEPGYTWRRLPWKNKKGPAPTWDKLLSRMTNASAFCAWIGSLFYEESSLQNYVWCHGGGNDGKGSINRFLGKVFGRAYRSKQPPGFNDRFWVHGLVGSRIVVFPDCNNQAFAASGLFKSLTGADPVDVEAKGQMSYTAVLNCKFLFFSNEKPAVSSERADMRRIIYCELDEAPELDPEFEVKLWDEGGAFLAGCMSHYAGLCPRHGAIPVDRTDLDQWVSTLEEDYERIFADFFALPHDEYRVPAGLHGLSDDQIALVTIKPSSMQKLLKLCFRERKDQLKFVAWLDRKYKVRKRTVRFSDVGPRYVYVGAHIAATKVRIVESDGYVADRIVDLST